MPPPVARAARASAPDALAATGTEAPGPSADCARRGYVFSVMVGTPRRGVPAPSRGGTKAWPLTKDALLSGRCLVTPANVMRTRAVVGMARRAVPAREVAGGK